MRLPIQFPVFSVPSLSDWSMPSQAKISSSVRAFVRAYPVPALAIGIVLAGFVLYAGKRLAAHLGIIEGRQMSPSGEAAQKRANEVQRELQAELGNPETALRCLQTDLVGTLQRISLLQARSLKDYVDSNSSQLVKAKWNQIRSSLLQLCSPQNGIEGRHVLSTDFDAPGRIFTCIAIMLPVENWPHLFTCKAIIACKLPIGSAQPTQLEFIVSPHKTFLQTVLNSQEKYERLYKALIRVLENSNTCRSDLWRIHHTLNFLGIQDSLDTWVQDLFRRNRKIYLGPFMNYLTDQQIQESCIADGSRKYGTLMLLSDSRLERFLEQLIQKGRCYEILKILVANYQGPDDEPLTRDERTMPLQEQVLGAFLRSVKTSTNTLYDMLCEKREEHWTVPDKMLGILFSQLYRLHVGKKRSGGKFELSSRLQEQLVFRIFVLRALETCSLFHLQDGPFGATEDQIQCIQQAFTLCPKVLHVILLGLVDVKLAKRAEGAGVLHYSVKEASCDEALITTFLEQLELLLNSQTESEYIQLGEDLKKKISIFIGALSKIRPYPRSLVMYTRTLMVLRDLLSQPEGNAFVGKYPKATKVLKEICAQMLEGPLKDLKAQL